MKRENTIITERLTLIVDMLSISLSFFLSAFIRGGIIVNGFIQDIYGQLLALVILSIVVISYMGNSNKNIFKRGFYQEFVRIIKDQGKLALIVFGFMFFTQESNSFSRVFLAVFYCLNVLICYVLRNYMKLVMLLYYKKSSASSKVMLIAESSNTSEIIKKIRSEYEWLIYVNSIALWDVDLIGNRIEGIEVVANRDNLLEMAKKNVVDEVFIHLPNTYKHDIEELVLEFEQMGVVVHINLDLFNNRKLKEKTINDFAGHQVVTFSSVYLDTKHAIIKRIIDLIGGTLGCIFTLILTVFLAPIILIESRGPIFFSQVRVGKNGRKFKIYKFRSMYKDAEQRKQELMERNEMKGLMFKMTDDPRITKVGKFLRKSCLDEFPQFFNVLMGHMSLVGTRPPTEDEFLQYEGRHKRRLSLKPGLTGLWQVSGRGYLDNFEDVVKLDIEYIKNWSLIMDLKLILKTVAVVFTGRGSR